MKSLIATETHAMRCVFQYWFGARMSFYIGNCTCFHGNIPVPCTVTLGEACQMFISTSLGCYEEKLTVFTVWEPKEKILSHCELGAASFTQGNCGVCHYSVIWGNIGAEEMQFDSNQPPDLLSYKKPQDRQVWVKQHRADGTSKTQIGWMTLFLNKVQGKNKKKGERFRETKAALPVAML